MGFNAAQKGVCIDEVHTTYGKRSTACKEGLPYLDLINVKKKYLQQFCSKNDWVCKFLNHVALHRQCIYS
eukprot:scaffold21648_cov18-Prasinocladus_malaysianus.AAC.2